MKNYKLVYQGRAVSDVLDQHWMSLDYDNLTMLVTDGHATQTFYALDILKADHELRQLHLRLHSSDSRSYTVVVPPKYRKHKRVNILRHLLSLLSTYSEIDTISINESEDKHVLTLSKLDDQLIVTDKDHKLSLDRHDQSVYDICGHAHCIHSYTIILKHETEESRDLDVFESI